jgi:uncharacterized membrane protein (DUF485 family)
MGPLTQVRAFTGVLTLVAGAVLCAVYVWLANWRVSSREPMASA